MFRSKVRSSLRMKSSSMLTLSEIQDRDKSTDWRNLYQVRPKEIGRGHFSKVYYVSCNNRGIPFAAKVIRRRKGGVDRLEKIKQEAELIRRLNDLGVQSVIQLFETYENFSEVVLISELAKGGSLFRLVQESDSNLPPDYVKVVTYKLLFALEAMHRENIVHLDIKADNILLREPYPSTDIALCDFGLATQLKQGVCHKELVGTPDYMAPEVINYETISVNADMWSVGVLVYFLLTGCSPFMGNTKDDTLVNVSRVSICFEDDIFKEAEYRPPKDFILALCVRGPEFRLSSSFALRHHWFSDIEDLDLDLPSVGADTIPLSEYMSENEDDLARLSAHQRCQSMDLHSLDMMRSLQMHCFSTASCENIFCDTPDFGSSNNTMNSGHNKLMNVEEVNDENINECSPYNHKEDIAGSVLDRDNTVCMEVNNNEHDQERKVKEYQQEEETREVVYEEKEDEKEEGHDNDDLPTPTLENSNSAKVSVQGDEGDQGLSGDDCNRCGRKLGPLHNQSSSCCDDKVIIPLSNGRGYLLEMLDQHNCNGFNVSATLKNKDFHSSELYLNICSYDESKNETNSTIKLDLHQYGPDIPGDEDCAPKSWSIFDMCTLC